MTWQERLRELDAMLADGRMTAAQHLRERDEVLAEASGVDPVRSSTAPFARTAGGVSGQETPVVAAPGRVPGEPEPRRAAQFHGQEVFAAGKAGRGRVVVGVLLMGVVLTAGGWWFVQRSTSEAPPVPAVAAAPTVASLPALPGTPSPNDGVLTVDRAVELRLLARQEGDILRGHGVHRFHFRGSTSGSTGYALIVIEATPEATGLTEDMRDHLRRTGYLDDVSVGGTVSQTKSSAASTVSRVTYTSGHVTVRVGVSRGAGSDQRLLSAELADVLSVVRERFPTS
ncbi:hypothetical protein [Actinokineospora sp.]|uniref:hypothetical protein n=1 Tax=Actinokineospora sp. TaxID=1872133 RepID=UPI003D6BB2BD